jgi:hypothetical protein
MARETKRKRPPIYEIKLKDPALHVHMMSFLGKPGSQKYRDFVKSLFHAKRQILGERRKMRSTLKGGKGATPKKPYLSRLNVLINNQDDINSLLAWVNSYNKSLDNKNLLLPEQWKNISVVDLSFEHLMYKPVNGTLDANDKETFLKQYDLYKSLFPFFTNIVNVLTAKLLTTEDTGGVLYKSLMTSMKVLRELNLYANPVWFDEMYYYFYFLKLDKVFSYFMAKYNKHKSDFYKTPSVREKRLDVSRYTLPALYDDRMFGDENDKAKVDPNEFIPSYQIDEPNQIKNDIDAANHMFNMLYYKPPVQVIDKGKISFVTQLPEKRDTA